MPDLAELLERAAATPTREPEVDVHYGKGRRARRLSVAAILLVAIAVPSAVVILRSSPAKVPPPSSATATTATTAPWPVYEDATNHFSIPIAPGWQRSSAALAPWLYSPHELLSLATVPLAPIDAPGNQAACPSEIPKAAVDGIGPGDAYIWIGEWRGGLYSTLPRPADFATAEWSPMCALPRGETGQGILFRDNGRDVSITVVFGAQASPERRQQVYDMLNRLELDGSAGL